MTVATNVALFLANAIIIAVTWSTLGAKSFRRLFSKDLSQGFAAILLWNGPSLLSSLSFATAHRYLQVLFISCTPPSSFHFGCGLTQTS